MRITFILWATLFMLSTNGNAQSNKGLISGPWAGNVELRNAMICRGKSGK